VKESKSRYLILYLSIIFGMSWSIGLAFLFFPQFMAAMTGGSLGQNNPIIVFVLYLPSIGGLITYYAMGGMDALKKLMLKFIPRKKDLFWFPVLFVAFVGFAAFMHFTSILFGVPVPRITLTPGEMTLKAIETIITEVGLLGGIFGWMAFLLPYFQAKFKSQLVAATATAIVFGLYVAPGYLITSFQQTTSYPLYVLEIVLFFVFISYIFNATRGNLTFYLYSFWLTATGSHIQLYYWNVDVQLMEITYFLAMVIILAIIFKRKNIGYALQKFPHFIEKQDADQSKVVVA